MEPNEPATPNRRTLVAVLAGVIVAALASGGCVYAYERSQNDKIQSDLHTQIDLFKSQVATVRQATSTPSPVATATPVASASSPVAVTASPDPYIGWKTYTDMQHGVSFKYPSQYGTVTVQDDAATDKLTGHSWDYKLSNADQPWFGFVSNDFQGTSAPNDYAVTGFIVSGSKCGWSTNKGFIPTASTDCLTVPGLASNNDKAYVANVVEHGTSKLYGFVPLSNINDGSKPAFTFVYEQPTATSSNELKAILSSFTLFN